MCEIKQRKDKQKKAAAAAVKSNDDKLTSSPSSCSGTKCAEGAAASSSNTAFNNMAHKEVLKSTSNIDIEVVGATGRKTAPPSIGGGDDEAILQQKLNRRDEGKEKFTPREEKKQETKELIQAEIDASDKSETGKFSLANCNSDEIIPTEKTPSKSSITKKVLDKSDGFKEVTLKQCDLKEKQEQSEPLLIPPPPPPPPPPPATVSAPAPPSQPLTTPSLKEKEEVKKAKETKLNEDEEMEDAILSDFMKRPRRRSSIRPSDVDQLYLRQIADERLNDIRRQSSASPISNSGSRRNSVAILPSEFSSNTLLLSRNESGESLAPATATAAAASPVEGRRRRASTPALNNDVVDEGGKSKSPSLTRIVQEEDEGEEQDLKEKKMKTKEELIAEEVENNDLSKSDSGFSESRKLSVDEAHRQFEKKFGATEVKQQFLIEEHDDEFSGDSDLTDSENYDDQRG